MMLRHNVKPITDLKSATAKLVRQVSEKGRTIIVTQNGEAKAVLMGVETYDRWRQCLSLLKLIEQSEADFAAGSVLSQEKAFARAAQKVDTVRGPDE